MESWDNTENEGDAYIQWIEYFLLTDVQQMTSLRHGSTHVAYWLEPTAAPELTKVTLKLIGEMQSLGFHQVSYLICSIM